MSAALRIRVSPLSPTCIHNRHPNPHGLLSFQQPVHRHPQSPLSIQQPVQLVQDESTDEDPFAAAKKKEKGR